METEDVLPPHGPPVKQMTLNNDSGFCPSIKNLKRKKVALKISNRKDPHPLSISVSPGVLGKKFRYP
jgi:hypothetical protein